MNESLEHRAIAAVRSLGKRGPTTRIPLEVRQIILSYAEAARRSGRGWRDIAGVVGVSAAALHNWRSAGAGPRTARPSKRRLLTPVMLRDDADKSVSSLTLVTASGHRIEGLDVARAAELVRLLA
jgi:hypothetical protein